jgi:hypothetical protein
MQAKVSLLQHLTRSAVRWTNRLRAVLLRYYPAASQVFSRLNLPISLELILAYPTPQAAADLTYPAFESFARQHGYPHPKRLPKRFAQLQQPYPEAGPETVLIYQQEAVILARVLLHIVRAKQQTLADLEALFEQHPDRAIFASLPGLGSFLAPAVLAKFGDDRDRFPSPAGVQALAGACPVTDQSGKRKVVWFRKACDREFRWIVHQWAFNSLTKSVWANAYWHQVRPRCGSDNHAYRCLANRWLAIAWKLWQTGQTYDEAYHLRQRALRSRPRP